MISWEEWAVTYKPTTEHEISLEDIADSVLPHYVWTMVDGDGRYANLWNGYRRFNRLGYFVTEVPWTEDVFVSNQKEF